MIPIVFSTDHKFIMPAGVTILSLLTTDNNEEYKIYILIAPDVTDNDKQMLEKQVKLASKKSSIDFISLGNAFQAGYEVRGISQACYYRLLIPWLLPQYDKIIYSDTDMIYHIGLREIYNTDITNYLFCGVNTSGFNSGGASKHIRKLGLDPKKYINSGFLIINATLNRKENLDVQYKKLASKKYLFQDQDIINIIGKDRIKTIDEKYNMSPKLSKKNESCIIHYTGIKPWDAFTFRWIEWWEVCKKSIFYDDSKYFDVSEKVLSAKELIKRYIRSIKYNIQKIYK